MGSSASRALPALNYYHIIVSLINLPAPSWKPGGRSTGTGVHYYMSVPAVFQDGVMV